jgi:hypothetical protein
LVEATIEKETPTTKESIALLNNPITAKRKKLVGPKEDPLYPRKSVRLMN